jgi:2-acylglycerol O-acyltransferase 2
MPAPASGPLNAEPTQPAERKEQQLPPKSYADAVEEGSPVNGVDGSNSTGGANGNSKGANGTGHTAGEPSKLPDAASVLRIVDTGAPGEKDTPETRPQIERQESQREYSATVCCSQLIL